MMTLEEVWENLRQDPEIKATMEEAEKSYKLFKKIENLIVSDLETKLAESEKEIEKCNDKWTEICGGKLETINRLIKEKQQLKDKLEIKLEELHIAYCGIENVKTKNGNLKAEVKQLKQQLAEKEQAIEGLQEINQSLGQTCNNDAKEIERLNKLLTEKEKECVIWERAYEYAIFECDFYKNHTQTTNEETMKRIEQLYEKILKRAKELMEDK